MMQEKTPSSRWDVMEYVESNDFDFLFSLYIHNLRLRLSELYEASFDDSKYGKIDFIAHEQGVESGVKFSFGWYEYKNKIEFLSLGIGGDFYSVNYVKPHGINKTYKDGKNTRFLNLQYHDLLLLQIFSRYLSNTPLNYIKINKFGKPVDEEKLISLQGKNFWGSEPNPGNILFQSLNMDLVRSEETRKYSFRATDLII